MVTIIRDGIIPFYQREFLKERNFSMTPLVKLEYKSKPNKPAYVWTNFYGTQEDFNKLPISKQKSYIVKMRTYQIKKLARVTPFHAKNLAHDFNGKIYHENFTRNTQ
ncbi:MAG: hypothetical protein IT238_03075 [Bacteroidia bacterium]|nr:hypothetical protein [Bacteroidia bacterium]